MLLDYAACKMNPFVCSVEILVYLFVFPVMLCQLHKCPFQSLDLSVCSSSHSSETKSPSEYYDIIERVTNQATVSTCEVFNF